MLAGDPKAEHDGFPSEAGGTNLVSARRVGGEAGSRVWHLCDASREVLWLRRLTGSMLLIEERMRNEYAEPMKTVGCVDSMRTRVEFRLGAAR